MATLGYTTAGSNEHSINPGMVVGWGPFQATEGGTATSISIYCYATTGANITLGIATLSGTTMTRVAQTAGAAPTTDDYHWHSQNITYSLVSGTNYYLVWNQGGTGDMWFYENNDAASYPYDKANVYSAGNLPATWASPWSGDYYDGQKPSIYVTYTPDATGPTVKTSTESARAGLSDNRNLLVTPRREDSARAGLSESLGVFAARAAGDALRAGLADVPTLMALFSRQDQLPAGVSETASARAGASRADLMAAGLSERDARTAAIVLALDALGAILGESATLFDDSSTLFALSSSDGIASGLAELSAALAAAHSADDLSAGLSSTAILQALLAREETLASLVAEALSGATSGLSLDALQAGLEELQALTEVEWDDGGELHPIGLTERAQVSYVQTSADAFGTPLVEAAHTTTTAAAIDTLRAGVDDALALIAMARSDDAILATVTETLAAFQALVAVAKVLGIGIGERGVITDTEAGIVYLTSADQISAWGSELSALVAAAVTVTEQTDLTLAEAITLLGVYAQQEQATAGVFEAHPPYVVEAAPYWYVLGAGLITTLRSMYQARTLADAWTPYQLTSALADYTLERMAA